MRIGIPILAALAILGGAGTAHATDPCTGIVLRDYSLPDHPRGKTYVVHRGYKIYRITQYRRIDSTEMYCAHGDTCYPIKSVKLNNCSIDYRDPYRGFGQPIYGLAIIRSRFSAAELRRLDLEDAMYRQDVATDRAEQYGETYARRPSGACGRLARGVLRGDHRAIAAMKRDIDADGNVVNPCILESLT